MATYMKTLSIFHNVMVTNDDVVFSQLPDNSSFSYFLDVGGPYSDAVTASHARMRGQPRTSQRRTASSATTYVMPDPTGAVEFLVDDASFPSQLLSTSSDFVPALQASGYKNVTAKALTVDNMLALKGTPLSILYISAHGGGFDGFLNIAPWYELLTSTPVSPELDLKYQALLASDASGAAQLQHAQTAPFAKPVYSVTTKFFATNVTFGANALVYVTACHSAAPAPGAQSIIRAIQGASTNAVYLGWTKTVLTTDGLESAAFVFDRMLGETSPSPFSGAPKPESPPERPFSLEEVLAYGASRARDDGQPTTEATSCSNSNVLDAPLLDGCNSKLVESSSGSANLMLAPSIAHMQVDETTGTLTVSGEFPGSSGSFAIDSTPPAQGGGTVLTASTWSATTATAQIQPSGPTAAGYIVARTMGVSGNAAPLTMWRGLTVDHSGKRTGDSGNYTDSFKITGSYDFRADIHPYRPAPGAAPTSDPNQTNFVMNTSTTHVGGGETHVIPGNQTYTATLNADPAWCVLKAGDPTCPGPNGFFGALFDPCPIIGTTGLCVNIFGYAKGTEKSTTGGCNNPDCSISLEFSVETPRSPRIGVVVLPTDANSNIQQTTVTGDCYDPFYGTGSTDVISCTLKTGAVTASFPPLPTTPQ